MTPLNSIKNKILLFAVLATLIPSVGLGLLSYWQNETMIADNVSHQLHILSADANREIEHWLAERVAGMRALSSSDAVINGLSHPSKLGVNERTVSPQVLPHYLRLVQEKLEPLLQLTVLDGAGQVAASSGNIPTPVLLSELWPQAATTEGVIVDLPHWNDSFATVTFTLAVPVLSLDNETLGALVAVIDLATVLPRLRSVANTSPGEVVLLDLTGKPLFSTHNEVATLSPRDPQVLQRLRAQEGEPMTFEGHLNHTVLGLLEEPRALPLMVIAERDRAEIYQAWKDSRDLFLSLLGALTLLVGLAAWRMGRSIVTPLGHLTSAADRIAAGDLSIQLPVAKRDELGRLTQVFNQMTDKLRRSHEEFEAASQALQKQNQLLETLSVTDSLTGLYNRKKLDDILSDQFERFKRSQRPFTVLLLDIDHFKTLNDSYGHLGGDHVLVNVAKTLSLSIRSVDYAARYGGEEFVIVLPDTTASAALELAERIRTQVQNASYRFNNQAMTVTLSVGVADSRSSDDSAYAVVSRADQMLYEAKRGGRNRVRHASV